MVSRFVQDAWVLDLEGARDAYLGYLGEAARTSDVEVLAYCLMSNHVHLVVVQGERPLERFIKSLHTGFSGWVHRNAPRQAGKKERARLTQGAVFADRPRTVLIDKDAYLLELVRYVHNNPVRAGVARHARSSTWSSHQAYMHRVDTPDWLRIGDVMERFQGRGRKAAARFDAFVDAGRKEERRPELSGIATRAEIAHVRAAFGDGHRLSDGVLGSKTFVARVRKDTARVTASQTRRGTERHAGASGRPTVQHVVDAVRLHCQVTPRELSERPKSRKSGRVKRLAIWMWVHQYAGKQVDVGRALKLDRSVASHHYRQAVLNAANLNQEARAVVALITKRGKRAPRPPAPRVR